MTTATVEAGVTTALAAVAAVMRDARDPWWVIGSAAVVLHGVVTDVADIDLLVSEDDATAAVRRLGLRADPLDTHPLFRSRMFSRWPRPDRTVRSWAAWRFAKAVRGDRWFLPPELQSVACTSRIVRNSWRSCPGSVGRRIWSAGVCWPRCRCTGAPG